MKVKVTQKELREGYSTIISVGYCVLQHLLGHRNPQYYNTGANGWNFDAYDIDGTLIVTGYRPAFDKCRAPYELSSEYNLKAQKVCEDMWPDWKAYNEARDKLLKEFIAKVIELRNKPKRQAKEN